MVWDSFGMVWGSFWDRFGINLGSSWNCVGYFLPGWRGSTPLLTPIAYKTPAEPAEKRTRRTANNPGKLPGPRPIAPKDEISHGVGVGGGPNMLPTCPQTCSHGVGRCPTMFPNMLPKRPQTDLKMITSLSRNALDTPPTLFQHHPDTIPK